MQSLHTSQVAHQTGAYPGFLSMKQLRVFLLPPGWDGSPSQFYPQLSILQSVRVKCPTTQHSVLDQGSVAGLLTMRNGASVVYKS